VPLSAYSNRGWVGFRYVCAGASSGLLAASGRLAGSRYGRGLNAAHHLTVFNRPVVSCQDLWRPAVVLAFVAVGVAAIGVGGD
jgi:hypothetical protein